MSLKPLGKKYLTDAKRSIPAALKKLRIAANGPRGSEPLTARGVAELCGVELKTVHNWAAEGLIAHFRTPGRHLRFQAVDVVRFLEECGFSIPDSSSPSRVLVIAEGPALTKLRRGLKGLPAEFVSEPLKALIIAGHLQPDAIIVTSQALKRLPLSEYLAALSAAFPQARLLCFGGPGTRKALLAYRTVPEEKLRTLRAELGLD